MRAFAVALVIAACTSRPATPTQPSNQLAPRGCDESREHTRAAIARARLSTAEADVVARQFGACWEGWSIALDFLCRVPEEAFDDTDERVSVLGRWVIMHGAATYKPVTSGVGMGCPDLGETNIATGDLARLVT